MAPLVLLLWKSIDTVCLVPISIRKEPPISKSKNRPLDYYFQIRKNQKSKIQYQLTSSFFPISVKSQEVRDF